MSNQDEGVRIIKFGAARLEVPSPKDHDVDPSPSGSNLFPNDTSVYVLLPFSQSQLKLVFFLPFSSQLFTYNTSPNLFKSLEVKKPERSNLFQRLYMGP
ncbi:hypothetical protein L1887_27694 [Cichorium endivia]|nr:hypothetical protein L1887_27694 [Cichorium endivia]